MAELDIRSLLGELVDANVDFLIIGGVAVGYHGHVRATKDVDVVPAPNSDNLERLASVLQRLDAEIEGADEFNLDELPDPLDVAVLEAGGNWVLATRLGRLDIMQWIGDEALWARLAPAATEAVLSNRSERELAVFQLWNHASKQGRTMKFKHGKQRLTAIAALGLLSVLAIATSAPAETTTVGKIKFTADGGFRPKALPKKQLAPIALTAKGRIQTTDGSHPPALKEVVLDTDKNGAVDVKGYPKCTSGKLQSQDTDAAEKICRKAIIGKGKTGVEIEFPDSRPVDVKSDLLVFNGGKRGGTTTLYIHAFITVPVPAAIVTTVKIKKIKKGRYGLRSVASIPKIAGGSGSVTSFNLTVNKKFKFKGKRKSILTAKCPDGKLQAHATAVFSDGTRAATDFVRPCRGKN